MKINFVHQPVEGEWSRGYHECIMKGFLELGCEISHVDTFHVSQLKEAVFPLPECDVWFVSGATDYNFGKVLDFAKQRGDKVVGHCHGGPETLGFVEWGVQEAFFQRFGSRVHEFDALFFNTEAHKNRFEHYYRRNSRLDDRKMHATGFPVDLSLFSDALRIKNGTILVSGRLSWERQPLLAAKILEPWKDQVLFATSRYYDTETDILTTAEKLRQWGFRVSSFVGEDYREVLKSSSVLFSASLADTASVSTVEAILAGAIPVVPNIVPFKTYVQHYLYEPYGVEKARSRVDEALVYSLAGDSLQQLMNTRSVQRSFSYKVVVSKMARVISTVEQSENHRKTNYFKKSNKYR